MYPYIQKKLYPYHQSKPHLLHESPTLCYVEQGEVAYYHFYVIICLFLSFALIIYAVLRHRRRESRLSREKEFVFD